MSRELIVQTTGVEETKIDDLAPDTNNDGDTTLIVGTQKIGSEWYSRVFARFDLSSIPAGSHVYAAELCFFNPGASGTIAAPTTFYAYRATNSAWTMAGVTWNDLDGVTPHTTAGGDFDPGVMDSVSISSPDDLLFTDSRHLVQDAIDKRSGSLEVLLVGPEQSTARFVELSSTENGTAADRPKVVVAYALASDPHNVVVAKFGVTSGPGDPDPLEYTSTRHGTGLHVIDATIEPSITDRQIFMSWAYLTSRHFILLATGDLTIETNSPSAPDDTLSVVANKPLVYDSEWQKAARPFSAVNIDNLYVTNPNAASVNLKIILLHEATTLVNG